MSGFSLVASWDPGQNDRVSGGALRHSNDAKLFCAASQAGLHGVMAGHGSERAWNEYEWERFLQQQDQKTERYMELLEKYIDDPHRDEIVAREMGWAHPTEEDAEEWGDGDEPLFADGEQDEQFSPNSLVNVGTENLEQHVPYR